MSEYRIKLMEPGFQRFSGVMGEIAFEQGVSVEPVAGWLAERLGSAMRVRKLEDNGDEGVSPGVSQQILDSGRVAFGSTTERAAEVVKNSEKPAEKAQTLPVYTRAELEEIADDKGIQGLREAIEPYGVKGRKIVELINAVMQIQRDMGRSTDNEPEDA